MKAAKIVFRIIAWICFIGGVALLVISKLIEYNKDIWLMVREWFVLDTAFMIGAVFGLCGLIMVAIVEDKANWESICRWGENRNNQE